MKMKILVTGGAGFIGSALIRYLIKETQHTVLNIDKLTYAGNLESIAEVTNNSRYFFERVDVCHQEKLKNIFKKYNPNAIINLAAETHVDRSIDGPTDFIRTNVLGTYILLEESMVYWEKLDQNSKKLFRFIHISTDEVYGSLGSKGYFNEKSSYQPNSPYSASKASSDHFVRTWYHTYGFPTIITNCSNNYGPYQFPEKLIPVVILNALQGKQIPVYGKGQNVRDWIFVDDHIKALLSVLELGRIGETYVIGSRCEKTNLEVVETICRIMDNLNKDKKVKHHSELIDFVKDRPGHDLRYAIDPSKINIELGWFAKVTFEDGIRKTVKWYLDNQKWCNNVMSGKYRLERLGLR